MTNEPCEVAKIGQRIKAADPLPASTWRLKLKYLAYWMLMAILGLTIWPTLYYLFLRA